MQQDLEISSVPAETFRQPLVNGSVGQRVQEQPQIIQQEDAYLVVTTPEEAKRTVTDLLKEPRPIGFDLETTSLSPRTGRARLAQLARPNAPVAVFDLDSVGGLEALRPVIETKDLIAHNSAFEMKWLLAAGIRPATIRCTMLSSNALTNTLPSLKAAVELYLGEHLDKELQLSDWTGELSREQITYAAKDADVTRRLWDVVISRVRDANRELLLSLLEGAVPAVAGLEIAGCPFDAAAHNALIEKWTQEESAARAAATEAFGPGVNLSSPKQLSEFFRRSVPRSVLSAWPVTETGPLKTDVTTLEFRARLHPAIPSLLAHRQVAKKLSTYGVAYQENIDNGRLYPSFRIGGAVSGRMTCSRPNLQNAPRNSEFRSLFVAPENRVLIWGDFGQIELRVAALLAQDEEMLAAFSEGKDLHLTTAARISGKPLADVSTDERQLAKALNFGLLFGMGAGRLQEYARKNYGAALSRSQAEEARRKWRSAYPAIARWQEDTIAEARQTGRVWTKAGRVRDFSEETWGVRPTEALNLPVQGSAAEITLRTLALLEPRLRGLDARLVNVVHDEIVLEAPLSQAEAAWTVLEEAMVRGYLDLFPGGPTKGLVGLHVGGKWTDAEE